MEALVKGQKVFVEDRPRAINTNFEEERRRFFKPAD